MSDSQAQKSIRCFYDIFNWSYDRTRICSDLRQEIPARVKAIKGTLDKDIKRDFSEQSFESERDYVHQKIVKFAGQGYLDDKVSYYSTVIAFYEELPLLHEQMRDQIMRDQERS